VNTWIEFVGWSGAFLILCGYIANSTGRLTRTDKSYQLINIIGSAEFVYYTAFHHTWATMTLNIVWCCVGTYSLHKIVRNPTHAE
jgi:energy-converting hydrogenase Eha subunit E